MPDIRDYTEAFTLLPSDAFVIDRIGIGTMYVEADDLPGGGGGSVIVNLLAAEAIFAGAFVNIFDNSGAPSMRLASGADIAKFATGFCLASVAEGAVGAVSAVGALNTSVSIGTTLSQTWLSVSQPGGFQATPPNTPGVGQFIQSLGPGIAGSPGIWFQPGLVIGL